MSIKSIKFFITAATAMLALPVFAQDTVRMLDEVLVSDTRAGNSAPLTTATLNKEELEALRLEVCVPFMLEQQTSVVVCGENGKMGGTSMSIRGIDASRINVNINGITLNDAESQTVFWYNIPNLGGMAQSMQIQRGVGASIGGASFGGAISLQTLNPSGEAYGEGWLAGGSWNSRQYGFAAGTGIGKRGLSFDCSYSGQTTDGYVRGGWADQQSLFACASWYKERSLLKLLTIIGTQHTGITWNGESAETLDADPRHNSAGEYYDAQGNQYYYPNESDNYTQQRYQLLWSYRLGRGWSLKSVADWTHGDGYYEQYKTGNYAEYAMMGIGQSDFVVQKCERNNAYTGNVSLHYDAERLSLSAGEMALFFDADHFGSVIWGRDSAALEDNPFEWYRNQSGKWDATSYAKVSYRFSDQFNLYTDLQLRYVDYRMLGPADDLFYLDFDEQYLFFNPKAGANWKLGDKDRLYLVTGIANREPSRADIKAAMGSRALLGTDDTVRAERLLDAELGYQREWGRGAFHANAYAMLYHDQLTPNGVLNSSGYAVKENVAQSYRLGIELEGGCQVAEWLRLDANLTLSTNKVVDYTYSDFVEGDTVLHTCKGTTDLSFSPNVVGGAMATFSPYKGLKMQLSAKYVGPMYMDNTSRECYRQDGYLLLNAKVQYGWVLNGHDELEVQLAVFNLLDNHYRLGAWCGDYEYEGYYHCAGWFQQPGINAMARIALKF